MLNIFNLIINKVVFMTIDASILKNKTELSLKVSKAVVEYIKQNRVVDGKKSAIKTEDLLTAAFDSLGVEEEFFEEEEQRKVVVSAVKKILTILEEVKAITPASDIPKTLKDYIAYVKAQKEKQPKPISGKPVSYNVASDFVKKIAALKTNELILGCDIATVELEDGEVSVLIAKNLNYEKVKFCNAMFDYSKLADYIGCYNDQTKKVDFLSTEESQRVFFQTNKKHVTPSQRKITNLYYLVNLSQYKTMFMPAIKKPTKATTVLSLRKEVSKDILTTDRFAFNHQLTRSL